MRWPHDGEKLVTYPGGVTREVDYDVRGPVSEIRIKPPAGTPLIEKWAYAYTDVLNVATMTDASSRVTTYGYDTAWIGSRQRITRRCQRRSTPCRAWRRSRTTEWGTGR